MKPKTVLATLLSLFVLLTVQVEAQSSSNKIAAGSISELGQWPYAFLNIGDTGKRNEVIREIFKDRWGQIVPLDSAEGADFTIAFIVQPKPDSKTKPIKFTPSNLNLLDPAWITSDHRGQMIAYRSASEDQFKVIWLDSNGFNRPTKAIKDLLKALSNSRSSSTQPTLSKSFESNETKPETMSQSLRPEILYREKAKYTEDARQNKIQGTVLLNVVFSMDGRIKNIRVVRGLPYGLTVTAIDAAKRIQFRPAMRDGQPVSVRGNVEFNFSLY